MTAKRPRKAPAKAGAITYSPHAGAAFLSGFLVTGQGETEDAARADLLAKLHTPEADEVAAIAGDNLQIRGIAAQMALLASMDGGAIVTEQQVARTAAKIEGKARSLLTEIQVADPEFKALTVLLRSALPGRADMEAQFIDSLRALAYPAHIDKSRARGAGRSPASDRGAWATLALFDLWERVTGEVPQHAERSRFARVAMVLLPQFGVEVDNWGDYLKRRLQARERIAYNV